VKFIIPKLDTKINWKGMHKNDAIKLAQCMKILAGTSDEHKFAGLLMVTKHLQSCDVESLEEIRVQVVNTTGVQFFIRLLHTKGMWQIDHYDNKNAHR